MLASALAAAGVSALIAKQGNLGLVDDAYISLRYARNWVGGNGLVYNPGEWVEGYSSFSYVALEALLLWIGVPAEQSAWLPSAAAQAFVAPVSAWLAAQAGVRSRLEIFLIAIAIALEPTLVVWARAGLEGPVYTLLVLLALASSLHERATWMTVATCGLMCVLAMATRPEGVVLVPLCAVALARASRGRALALFSGCSCACAGGMLLRHRIYGDWLPNTYYAKLDGGGLQLAWRGLEYVSGGMIFQLPMVLLALAGFFLSCTGRLPQPRWLRVVLAWLVTLLAVTVWEGGDHFPFQRFLTPGYALLALCALGPYLWATDRNAAPRKTLAAFLLATVCSWAAFMYLPWPTSTHRTLHVEQVMRARQWVAAGRALAVYAPAEATIGAMAIGGLGFSSDLRILDALGLVDAHIAHAKSALGRGVAGHEKFDNAYFYSRRPDAIIMPPEPVDVRLPRSWIPTVLKGDIFDALMRDPRLEREYTLVYIPVADTMWLHTFVRRDRLARWKLPASARSADAENVSAR